MHQSTTPSLSQTIWPRWASRQLLILPIVQFLLPMTFAYSLSSKAVVTRQLGWWKRHAHTRGLPWGLAEVVGTVQQVHCSRSRLLRMGQGFHTCTINKNALTKKSGNLSYAPRIYIYIIKISGKIDTSNSYKGLVEMIIHSFILSFKFPFIFLISRVFANGPGDWDSIPGRVIPKTQKSGTWCRLA